MGQILPQISYKMHCGFNMKKVFWTADTHWGHANIIKYCHRPFLSERDKAELSKIGAWHNGIWKDDRASRWRITPQAVEMMNDALFAEINAIVGENDILWHLGDFAMAPKDPDKLKGYYNRCRTYRNRIRCQTINIVFGNHDNRCIADLFNEAYGDPPDEYVIKSLHIPESNLKLSMGHFAPASFDKSHKKFMALYGHSHSEAEKWLDEHMPERRTIDVGVDNAAKLFGKYRPFSEEDISTILSPRLGFAFDHHVGKIANSPDEHDLN